MNSAIVPIGLILLEYFMQKRQAAQTTLTPATGGITPVNLANQTQNPAPTEQQLQMGAPLTPIVSGSGGGGGSSTVSSASGGTSTGGTTTSIAPTTAPAPVTSVTATPIVHYSTGGAPRINVGSVKRFTQFK